MARIMILWLIESTEDVGYDEYDGAVVAASSEADALSLHHISRPVSVKIIGRAVFGAERGIILESFRAG